MKNILFAILAFVVIKLYYAIFIIRKKMTYRQDKASIEVRLLVTKYKLDMKRINYYNLMRSIALINSLDIAIVVFGVSFIEKLNIQCLVSIFLIIPVILISYTLFGNYLVKKGLVMNDGNRTNKKNRK